MSSEPTNAERQERAQRALLAHLGGEFADDDPTTDIVDLVANLMHLCNREGCDWSDIESMAKAHYEFEVNDDR